jgi:hypothetical protein
MESDSMKTIADFSAAIILGFAVFAALAIGFRGYGQSPDLDVVLPAGPHRKAVVCTQAGCPPCAKMKKDLAGVKFDFEVEWASTRDKKWKCKAAPTTVKLVGGREVDRKEGYLSADEMRTWMKK